MALTFESGAARADAVLAPAIDLLTAECAYGPRLAALERLALALRHGLAGRRLLDVCCGTSRSFIPLLERGFEVHRLRHLAGLEVAAVVGQRPGAVLDDELDAWVHCKAVFVMRREGRSR